VWKQLVSKIALTVENNGRLALTHYIVTDNAAKNKIRPVYQFIVGIPADVFDINVRPMKKMK
jgi:hypothetical protein